MSQDQAQDPQQEREQESLFKMDYLKWSPLLKIVILLIGTAISFLISFCTGSVSGYLPFISETGAHIPEMFIFSMTLYIGSVIGLVIVLYQFLIMQSRLSARQVKLQSMNKTACICGIVSMIGLAGVAAVPMSTVLWVHLVFAGIHFTFALIYTNCMTFIIFFIPGGGTKLNKIRMVLCVILLLILISLVVMFPLSHFKWIKVNHHPPATKTPKDMFFDLMLASTSLEWTMYAVYLTIMGSFYFEFRNYQLVYGISAVQN